MDPEQLTQLIDERIAAYFTAQSRNSEPVQFPKGFSLPDRFFFNKLTQFMDGQKIQFGKSNGVTIGTEAAQKIAFHGATPVIQASAVTKPSGGATQDTEARTAISSVIDVLHNKGFTA